GVVHVAGSGEPPRTYQRGGAGGVNAARGARQRGRPPTEAPGEAPARRVPRWTGARLLVRQVVADEQAEEHEIRRELTSHQLEQPEAEARADAEHAEVDDLDRPAGPFGEPGADQRVPHAVERDESRIEGERVAEREDTMRARRLRLRVLGRAEAERVELEARPHLEGLGMKGRELEEGAHVVDPLVGEAV